MDLEATPMLDHMVPMTWNCLEQPVHQNELFKQYFFDIDVLVETASDAALSFCPGLLDALEDDEPPDVSFFETLPTDIGGRWGVYGIVLKRPDGPTLIYTGSGTDAKIGVARRFIAYNNPEKVRQT
jgi:hypothetical protein